MVGQVQTHFVVVYMRNSAIKHLFMAHNRRVLDWSERSRTNWAQLTSLVLRVYIGLRENLVEVLLGLVTCVHLRSCYIGADGSFLLDLALALLPLGVPFEISEPICNLPNLNRWVAFGTLHYVRVGIAESGAW